MGIIGSLGVVVFISAAAKGVYGPMFNDGIGDVWQNTGKFPDDRLAPMMQWFQTEHPEFFKKDRHTQWVEIGARGGDLPASLAKTFGMNARGYDVMPRFEYRDDYNPEAFKAVSERWSMKFDGQSLEKVEPNDHTVDVMNSFFVLHHAAKGQSKLIAEARRLLKPKGWLLVAEDNNTPKWQARNKEHDSNGIFRTQEEWKQWFGQHGFETRRTFEDRSDVPYTYFALQPTLNFDESKLSMSETETVNYDSFTPCNTGTPAFVWRDGKCVETSGKGGHASKFFKPNTLKLAAPTASLERLSPAVSVTDMERSAAILEAKNHAFSDYS